MVNIQYNIKKKSVRLANLRQSDFFEFQDCIWQVLFKDKKTGCYSCYNYNQNIELGIFDGEEEVRPLNVTVVIDGYSKEE